MYRAYSGFGLDHTAYLVVGQGSYSGKSVEIYVLGGFT